VGYAVATLGTATTPYHITKLMRQTDDIVFCFDGDAAGRKAAWRAAINSLPALTDGLRLSFLFLPPEHDPDSYIREFGKDGFETALKETQPLSQYLVQTLSSANDMQSQEGRVRFLNDAEPILKQIQAPALSLLLRKRCAELAGVSQAELESLMNLAQPAAKRKSAPARSSRKPPTLVRRLIQMVLLKPHLALQLSADMIPGSGAEEEVLVQLIRVATENPKSATSALLQALRGSVPENLMAEISAEVMEVDDAFEVEDEFEGALKQLRENLDQKQLAVVLRIAQEQGLQALSQEQKMLLQQFRRGAVQGNEQNKV
jgi:DNA primase